MDNNKKLSKINWRAIGLVSLAIGVLFLLYFKPWQSPEEKAKAAKAAKDKADKAKMEADKAAADAAAKNKTASLINTPYGKAAFVAN